MTTTNGAAAPRAWRRLTVTYGRLLDWLLAASVGVLILPVTLQVISRFSGSCFASFLFLPSFCLPSIPHYIWTEEMARFLFIWTVMIGSIVGVREASHFEVDVWPELGRRAEAIVRVLARLGILALAIIFITTGWEFTKFAWNRTSELADLPLWMIHVAWPFAGVSWAVFVGEQLYDEAKIAITGAAP